MFDTNVIDNVFNIDEMRTAATRTLSKFGKPN